MKRVANFIRLRYIMFVLSVVLIAGGITGIFVQGGFNLGIDYLAGLSQRVQVAPIAFSFTFEGNGTASLDIRNQAVAMEIRGDQGVQTFEFPFSRYPTLRSLDSAFDTVPGLVVELRLAGEISSRNLVAGLNFPITISDSTEVLNAVEPEGRGRYIGIDQVRTALDSLGSPQIQVVGQEYEQEFLVRFEDPEGQNKDYLETQVEKLLEAEFGANQVVIKQSDYVGPRFSRNLGQQSVLLTVLALGLILVYIWFRFRLAYAVSAITALAHDVLIMLGFIGTFQLEVSTSTVAAVLTIIGYSLNDTIVVFDRVRENTALMRDTKFTDVVNQSITQSLSRTLITSLTTMLAVMALYVFGSGPIKMFALNLMVGIIVGTYSSIFIASPVLHAWVTSARKRRGGRKVEGKPAAVSTDTQAAASLPEKTDEESAPAKPVKIPKAERKLKGKRQKQKKKN